MLGGGFFPQPGVATRQRAAEEILRTRADHLSIDKKARSIEAGRRPQGAAAATVHDPAATR
jgi:hypothetical protein